MHRCGWFGGVAARTYMHPQHRTNHKDVF